MATARRKIVVIPAWYPHAEQPINGVFIHEQAQGLAPHHDVTVLFPNLAVNSAPSVSEESVDGVRIFRVAPAAPTAWARVLQRFHPPTSIEAYYRKSWDAVRQGFEHYIRAHGKPDVIHAHVVLPSGWIAWQLGMKWRIPVVLTEHTGPFTLHLATPWQRRLALETLRGVDRLFAVSPMLAGIMQTCFPEVAPDVLGNMIRTDFFTPAPQIFRPKFRFLSIALLVEGKGIQHLLEAASLLRAHGLEAFEILIGGDGPYRTELEAVTERWGLRDRCQFLGLLDRHQVREHMRQCDAFVLPSWSETFCMVLCEAMACGKPVISTRCGGPEYTVNAETGILVPVAQPYELADAMAGFLRGGYSFDSQVIRQSVVARFGIEAFVDKLELVYNNLISNDAFTKSAA